MAEAGLNYDSLLELYKPEPEPDSQAVKDGLKKKVGEDTNDTDIDELVKLMDRYGSNNVYKQQCCNHCFSIHAGTLSSPSEKKRRPRLKR